MRDDGKTHSPAGKWVQMDKWHIRNGEWTITKAANVKYPYGLWGNGKPKGNYATLEEAKQEYERLTK